ncbi:class I SAM-dependent methyltransferase [Pseudomonas entomophila]|uniref:class I SAM-dependent methyltransferase n=1 Tax=Pseudomonas entomophila TaxID=312306 RepID=UPI0023D8972F|nr:class I SAM-dependent methyltransferase [Pseudomonas entomophila]MDF0732747.1 class I SAM-dependent methyltransferase [Pseudomonas entomophila]
MQSNDQSTSPVNLSSALRVAMARAVHQLLDEPRVFEDVYALPVLGERLSASLRDDPFRFNDPVMRTIRAAVVARSVYAEQKLAQGIDGGIRQYVLLGAGLDTYALRQTAPNLTVYEVDLPAALASKRASMQALSVCAQEAARHVPCDLQHEALLTALQAHGFKLDQPAFVSWLGVTPYLGTDRVEQTLEALGQLAPGSQVVFDYRVAPALLSPLEQAMEAHAAELFARMGEPWRSSFEPAQLRRMLEAAGFAWGEDLGSEEINQRYFPRRKDGLQASGGGFRLLHAMRVRA